MLFLEETLDLQSTDLYIYNYICRNLNSVIYMRIRELSLATNVSTTTILRFCKKFHCSGYSEFKFRLQEYVTHKSLTSLEHYDESSNIAFLNYLQQSEFDDKLMAAASLIRKSDLLFFIGLGGSGIAANYGSYLFSSLVSFSSAITDPLNTPLYHLNECFRSRICLVALSISGEQEDIIEFIDNLKQYDASVISITNKGNTSLERFSDLNICCHMPQKTYYSMDVSSLIPAIAILEMLAHKMHALKQLPDSDV